MISHAAWFQSRAAENRFNSPYLKYTLSPLNGSTVHGEPQMPFGGKAALEEFIELRWITTGARPTSRLDEGCCGQERRLVGAPSGAT
jgi:hypothetical protein